VLVRGSRSSSLVTSLQCNNESTQCAILVHQNHNWTQPPSSVTRRQRHFRRLIQHFRCRCTSIRNACLALTSRVHHQRPHTKCNACLALTSRVHHQRPHTKCNACLALTSRVHHQRPHTKCNACLPSRGRHQKPLAAVILALRVIARVEQLHQLALTRSRVGAPAVKQAVVVKNARSSADYSVNLAPNRRRSLCLHASE
jgi:hypothetical protein